MALRLIAYRHLRHKRTTTASTATNAVCAGRTPFYWRRSRAIHFSSLAAVVTACAGVVMTEIRCICAPVAVVECLIFVVCGCWTDVLVLVHVNGTRRSLRVIVLMASTVNYLCLGIFCLVKNNVASCAYLFSFFFRVERRSKSTQKYLCNK